ncbi:MAG: Clp protease ClpP [Pusillimonas sp.]|nr:Clp protease ClpP [Pusillimonas sp.]
MINQKMPAIKSERPSAASHVLPKAFDRWNPGIKSAVDEDRSITVYDVIGVDWWTGEGVTAKRISAALRSMGPGSVTVNINSPGGDMFEGFAIYNLLREHEGEVTVKVMGLAASAASIIAMAGDTIQIARAGFFMVHNCWVAGIGNRHDLRDIADTLEPFDAASADIYSVRTGQSAEAMQAMMDAESWIGGSTAVEEGFADELLPSDQIAQGESRANAAAVRRVEAALRSSGLPRNEAQKLISDFKASVRDASGGGESDSTERGLSDSGALSMAAQMARSLTKSI